MESIADVLAGKTQWCIEQGNSLDILRDIPDNCIQMVVTSPPFWNLRDYKLPPSIWGGDPNCPHCWTEHTKPRRSRDSFECANSPKQLSNKGSMNAASGGKVCDHCGAWLGCLGDEETPDRYIANSLEIYHEVKRILRPDGTFWINISDTYSTHTGKNANAGQFGKGIREGFDDIFRKNRRTPAFALPEKNLCMIPARLAIALQNDGWIIRSEIIWHKRAPMPEPVRDRPAKAHEQIYLLTKQPHYFYDAEAVKEPLAAATIADGRTERAQRGTAREYAANDGNCGYDPAGRHLKDVWWLSPEPFIGEHYAVFPSVIPRTAILAGTSEAGCCIHCGKPWQRIVDTKPMVIARSNRQEEMGKYGKTQSSGTMLEPSRTITRGWRQACKCPEHQPVPCIVLDPFSGAGTTGMVALRLGRRFIGLELSEKFATMSRQRIQNDCPLFNMAG